VAECEDIIQALDMDFNEACEFKAIWRTAAARKGNGKPGNKALYDAQKRLHYAGRSVRLLEQQQQIIDAGGWHENLTGKPPARFDVNVEVKLVDGTYHKNPTNVGNLHWALGQDASIEFYRFTD
jgi:hypothetical protein